MMPDHGNDRQKLRGNNNSKLDRHLEVDLLLVAVELPHLAVELLRSAVEHRHLAGLPAEWVDLQIYSRTWVGWAVGACQIWETCSVAWEEWVGCPIWPKCKK